MALNNDTQRVRGGKKSLVEFATTLRGMGCGHKKDVYFCRVCGEDLAEQILFLGENMIKLKVAREELDRLNAMVPKFLFTGEQA